MENDQYDVKLNRVAFAISPFTVLTPVQFQSSRLVADCMVEGRLRSVEIKNVDFACRVDYSNVCAQDSMKRSTRGHQALVLTPFAWVILQFTNMT